MFQKETENNKDNQDPEGSLAHKVHIFFLESRLVSEYLGGIDESYGGKEGMRDIVYWSTTCRTIYTHYNYAKNHIENIIIQNQHIDNARANYYCHLFPKFKGLKAIQLIENTFQSKRAVFLMSNLIIELSPQLTCFGFTCYNIKLYADIWKKIHEEDLVYRFNLIRENRDEESRVLSNIRERIYQEAAKMREERSQLIKKHLVISPSLISEIILEALISKECDLSRINTLRIRAAEFESMDSFIHLLQKCPLVESLDINFSSLRRNLDGYLNPNNTKINIFPHVSSNSGLDDYFVHEILGKTKNYEDVVSRVFEHCDLHERLHERGREIKIVQKEEKTEGPTEEEQEHEKSVNHCHLLSPAALQNYLPNLKAIYYSPHPCNYFYDYNTGNRSCLDHLLDIPILRSSFSSEHNIDLISRNIPPNEINENEIRTLLRSPHPAKNTIFPWWQMEHICLSGLINPFVGSSILIGNRITRMHDGDVFIPRFKDPLISTLASESRGGLKTLTLGIPNEMYIIRERSAYLVDPCLEGPKHEEERGVIVIKPGLVSICKDYDSLFEIISLNRNSLGCLDLGGWEILPHGGSSEYYRVPAGIIITSDQPGSYPAPPMKTDEICTLTSGQVIALLNLLQSCQELKYLRLSEIRQNQEHMGLEKEFQKLEKSLNDRGGTLDYVTVRVKND